MNKLTKNFIIGLASGLVVFTSLVFVGKTDWTFSEFVSFGFVKELLPFGFAVSLTAWLLEDKLNVLK